MSRSEEITEKDLMTTYRPDELSAELHLDQARSIHPATLAGSIIGLARNAIGVPATLRVALPDSGGELSFVAEQRNAPGDQATTTETLERAFRSGSEVHSDVPGMPELSRACLPLLCGTTSVGVLDVIAPRQQLDGRLGSLREVARRAASLLAAVDAPDELGSSIESLADAVTLARDLMNAVSPEAALRAVTSFCFRRLEWPVAGWLGRNPSELNLITARGLDGDRHKQLWTRMRRIRVGEPRAVSLEETSARFAEAAGAPKTQILDAGTALVVIAQADVGPEVAIEPLASLLRDALRQLAPASTRSTDLDSAIVYTAHEMRGPLLGVKAGLERLLMLDDYPASHRNLLDRCHHELQEVTGLIEEILRWSVGDAPLRKRPTDVVELVRDAAESCALEVGEDRVYILGPPRATISADSGHLRAAIRNLLRNALAYSPTGSTVRVEIHPRPDRVTVSVKDEGPGVPAEERDAIFDPFTRGRAARGGHGGSGLGLFIARRVVEAHGGRIWLDISDGAGASFHVELPEEPVS